MGLCSIKLKNLESRNDLFDGLSQTFGESVSGRSGPMVMHISARVAWHMDGWNGHICQDPASNTYCVGSASYPGEWIAEHRDLAWEH